MSDEPLDRRRFLMSVVSSAAVLSATQSLLGQVIRPPEPIRPVGPITPQPGGPPGVTPQPTSGGNTGTNGGDLSGTTVVVGTVLVNATTPAFEFAIPTYHGAVNVPHPPVRSVTPPGSNPQPAPPVSSPLPNVSLGGQLTVSNATVLNLKFVLSGWVVGKNHTVRITLGSRTLTAGNGQADITFANVTGTGLTMAISVDGTAVTPTLLPLKISSSVSAMVRPHYQILSVLYAPPGTAGGHSTSVVDYSTGSSAGTTVSSSSSFKGGIDITATVGFNGGPAGSGSVSLEFGYSHTDQDDSSLDVKKSQNYEIKANGPGSDGINHDHDQFCLWLNATVTITVTDGKRVTWAMGVDGNDMLLVYPYVGHLKNPSLLPVGDKALLDQAGLTTADYAEILKVNPFSFGATAIDPNRYALTPQGLNYSPPYSPTDSPLLQTLKLEDDTTYSQATTETSQTNIGITVTYSQSWAVVSASLKVAETMVWTNSSSHKTTTVATQSASATVGGPAYGYAGPTEVLVYIDTIFKTFMFAFTTATPDLSGSIADADGKAVAHQAISLTADGKTYRTFTGPGGAFKFFGVPAGEAKLAASGQQFTLAAGQHTAPQTVRLKHS